jgi:RimJ/RimL family protein N-acetyltransferase
MILAGDLVRLRPIELTDLDRYCTWVVDREVTQWLTITYLISRQDEEKWLRERMTQTRPPRITLAIETLADERHIGSIDLDEHSREDRRADLGIMIGDKAYWSQGYGTDAIRTLLRFGFDEMNLNRVSLQVLAQNQRAIASYRKCGFVEEARLRDDWFSEGRFQDVLVMGVLASEFRDRSIP